MSTSDNRLGELRTRLLPDIVRHLAKKGSYPDTGALNLSAIQNFDRVFAAAETFHSAHQDEDADLHLANLMQMFHEELGIPYLQALPVIEEFILPP